MRNDPLNQRLESLKTEHEAGKKMLAELDDKRQQLYLTMTRIEGAMQVLAELIESRETEQAEPAPAPPPPVASAPALS